MTTRSNRSYDHPNNLITREVHQLTVAGNASILYFHHFQKMRLRGIHAIVAVAGTGTGNNTFIPKSGTTALGTFLLGTGTQGVTSSLDVSNTDVSALGQLSVLGGADVVGVAEIIWEFEVLSDSVQTA